MSGEIVRLKAVILTVSCHTQNIAPPLAATQYYRVPSLHILKEILSNSSHKLKQLDIVLVEGTKFYYTYPVFIRYDRNIVCPPVRTP
ncbi:unnamed protein product [Arctia plantaginis]|uniref:Uncharacterized protein n=1 Tax=Arctia plantaginis TaxID=874455 RepID=A0A8S0YVT0_ARCPL|nr:unnamed protein product [Arctia plantaginis]